MGKLKYAIITLMIFTIIGCEAVYISHPLGDKPVKLDAKNWEGTWLHKDGILVTKILDSEKGLLNIAWIENSNDKLNFETEKVCIRESAGHMFWNKKDKDQSRDDSTASHKDRYVWGKIKRIGHQIILWYPDIDTFKNLVGKGTLPGKIDNGSVILDDLNPKQLKMFIAKTEALLYDQNIPFALILLSE